MRVALVYPETYELARFKEKRKEFPPFGVLYLASFLEENGVEVKIFKINEEVPNFDLRDYDVVGFSTPSSATYGLVKGARFGSLYSRDATIAVGGVHASFYPKATLVDLEAHVVAIGSGEKTLMEIVRAHSAKDFSSVKGACFMNGQSLVLTQGRPLERDIDWLPLPSRHLLNESDLIMNDRLANTNTRMAHIMMSRGCLFSCHFCAVFQKKVQCRSGANVKMELEHLKQRYKIDGFAVVDDNFIVNKRMVKDVCQAIRELGMKWSALSRVDTVDYELLESLFDAGCIELKFGVESGSERMLQAMGKKVTTNHIKRAITLATSAGIMVKIFLIHGFPGEDMTSTRDTISLLKEIAPMVDRVSLFRFSPLPGSYVFRNAAAFKLKIPKKSSDWERYHIHHNNFHWWGNDQAFAQLERAYGELEEFIADNWKHN